MSFYFNMNNINISDVDIIALNKKINLTNLNKLLNDLIDPTFQLKYSSNKNKKRVIKRFNH